MNIKSRGRHSACVRALTASLRQPCLSWPKRKTPFAARRLYVVGKFEDLGVSTISTLAAHRRCLNGTSTTGSSR
jgi:hypothetical protein